MLSLGRLAVVALLAGWMSGTMNAQTSSASVTGAVRDSSGSVIPAASLILRNTETSVELRTESNEVGAYTFLNVNPGTYTLETAKAGFRTTRLAPFSLAV